MTWQHLLLLPLLPPQPPVLAVRESLLWHLVVSPAAVL
jgi:hypothetical protein